MRQHAHLFLEAGFERVYWIPAVDYALRRRGPLTIPPALVNAFVRSDPSQPTPDLQFVCYPITYDKLGDPPHAFPGFTAGVCMLHPESRGSVTLLGPRIVAIDMGRVPGETEWIPLPERRFTA